MLHVASAAVSMAYTDLLKNQSMLLENQVTERTRELVASQQELEQAMQRSNALAEAAQAASQAKGDFLAKMSHELRTPLNGIIGMTDVALTTELTDSQRRIVEIISRESFSLLRQINDVLDFSKIEAGKLELERIAFDPCRLVEEVGESFIFQTTENGIELNVFVDPAIPGALIGDPVRLRQVLLNLTGNAVKFTHAGEILIEARLEKRSGDQAVLRFAVVDTGIGIEADKVDRIFSSFSQADNSTTRRYGGTGLGTTISKQLVELMGGRIQLTSRAGEGSTFWFSANFGVDPAGRGVTVETDRQAGRSILVVTNSTTMGRVLSVYLDRFGVVPVTVADAEGGLDVLAKPTEEDGLPICAVIVDDQLSGINARTLRDRIKALSRHAHLPIVIATSLKDVVTGEDVSSLGFDHALAKPVTVEDLKAIVRRVTGRVDMDPSLPSKPSSLAADVPPGEDRGPRYRGRVLVADDYLVNQQVAYMHLTAAGFTVDLVDEGIPCHQGRGRHTRSGAFVQGGRPP